MRLCDNRKNRSYHSEEGKSSFASERPRDVDFDASMREKRKNAHNEAEPRNDLHDWRTIELRDNHSILHLERALQLTSLAETPQVKVRVEHYPEKGDSCDNPKSQLHH
jgi:hypothetical protein